MAEVSSTAISRLATLPGVQCLFTNCDQVAEQNHLIERKVFIWQRPLFATVESAAQSIPILIQRGYIVVIDWDDDQVLESPR